MQLLLLRGQVRGGRDVRSRTSRMNVLQLVRERVRWCVLHVCEKYVSEEVCCIYKVQANSS